MFKKILIATVLTVAASSAMANGSHIQGCGPDARIYADNTSNNHLGDTYDNSSVTAGFSLTWTFGKRAACEQHNAAVLDQKTHAIRFEAARANSSEAKALSDKLRVCSTFNKETAPESIMAFCGDLLQ